MSKAKFRFIIGIRRSGTTALLTALAQSDEIIPLYQPMQSARVFDDVKNPLENVLERDSQGKIFIVKETIGIGLSSGRMDDLYNSGFIGSSFRSQIVCPVFVLREPIQCWASWRILGWDISKYISSYLYVFRLFISWREEFGINHPLTYELLVNHPESALQKICKIWDINYSSNMIDWKKKFSEEVVNMHPVAASENLQVKAFDTLKKTNSIAPHKRSLDSIPCDEKILINSQLMDVYEFFCSLSTKENL